MLETGAAAVDVIGRELGYEDTSSFGRLTGISPGDYRRRFRIPDYARFRVSRREAWKRSVNESEAG